MDSSLSQDREHRIIKEAVDKLTKQFRAHPEKIDQTKGIQNLFSILKNLVNGSVISAKMDIKLVNDFTVDAMVFMVKNKILSIPSLELGIQHGYIKDYQSFNTFYNFTFLETKIPSGVNTTQVLPKTEKLVLEK